MSDPAVLNTFKEGDFIFPDAREPVFFGGCQNCADYETRDCLNGCIHVDKIATEAKYGVREACDLLVKKWVVDYFGFPVDTVQLDNIYGLDERNTPRRFISSLMPIEGSLCQNLLWEYDVHHDSLSEDFRYWDLDSGVDFDKVYVNHGVRGSKGNIPVGINRPKIALDTAEKLIHRGGCFYIPDTLCVAIVNFNKIDYFQGIGYRCCDCCKPSLDDHKMTDILVKQKIPDELLKKIEDSDAEIARLRFKLSKHK